eukprot:5681435-Amphidinium_carterae.1
MSLLSLPLAPPELLRLHSPTAILPARLAARDSKEPYKLTSSRKHVAPNNRTVESIEKILEEKTTV